ncbi:CBS domain-containing protein [Burkholderia sp. Bp8998]|uniref:CBS domain-containing protein n=1 Tax=Burkholderia sp. Bp8998 TaxID=2184557 RepID=UPI0021AB24A8|nr:CBS domain-containing protein [Burkholderia sp. Bp8998]
MWARDVMTTSVIFATPEMGVQEAAKLLAEHSISAVPVVDADGRLICIVREGIRPDFTAHDVPAPFGWPSPN